MGATRRPFSGGDWLDPPPPPILVRSNSGSLQRAKGTLGNDGHVSFAFFGRHPSNSTTTNELAEILIHFFTPSTLGFWRVGWNGPDEFWAYMHDAGAPLLADPGNDWFFCAFAQDEDDYTFVYRRAADVSFSSFTRTIGEWQSGTGGVAFGATVTDSVVDGSWPADCEYGGLKIWSATLSQSELEAEFASLTPVRTANIWFANDGSNPATVGTDQSGAGNNFSVLGSWTAAVGAPSWL